MYAFAYNQWRKEIPMDKTALSNLISRYKSDPESVYNTWFVGGEERMKAFRAIRRGVRDTVDSIVAGTFGNDFKGSPLEVVLSAITEQKQVFEGLPIHFSGNPSSASPISMKTKTTNASLPPFWKPVSMQRARNKSWRR